MKYIFVVINGFPSPYVLNPIWMVWINGELGHGVGWRNVVKWNNRMCESEWVMMVYGWIADGKLDCGQVVNVNSWRWWHNSVVGCIGIWNEFLFRVLYVCGLPNGVEGKHNNIFYFPYLCNNFNLINFFMFRVDVCAGLVKAVQPIRIQHFTSDTKGWSSFISCTPVLLALSDGSMNQMS